MPDEKKEEKKPTDEKKAPDAAKPAEGKSSDDKKAPEAAKSDDKKAPDAPKADAPKSDGVVMILANKPGEPAFQMKIEPVDKLSFKSDKLNEEPVSVEVKLENTTGKRQTFKVKCTSNEVFRVRPPLGFIEDKAMAKIKITFQAKDVPEPNKHFFAMYHMAVEDKALNQPRTLWTATAKPEGVKRLACSFEKADGSQWPVAEKK